MKHSKYLDKLRDNKFKHLNMNHRDRDSFLKYISDTNTTCSNVKRRTRRQLNPDQCKFNQLIFFSIVSLFLFWGLFIMSRSLLTRANQAQINCIKCTRGRFQIHRFFGEIKRES